jgi:hypothetical protein
MSGGAPNWPQAFRGLIAALLERHEHVDREHGRAPYKTGPKRGQVRYDDRYWHGYRDALEDTRMAVQDALRDLETAQMDPEVTR